MSAIFRAPPRRRRWLALVAVLVLVGGGIVAKSTWPESKPGSGGALPSAVASQPRVLKTVEGPAIPKRGAYVGAWVNPNPFTQDGRVSSFEHFEASVGKPLNFVHLYRKWQMPFGTPSDLAFARSGKDLLISWPAIDTRRIASGAVDAVIAKTARQIAALPTKVFFEFRWEMDRPNLRAVVHGPKDYIAAWDHVRAIFHRERVTNVAWTWCPTAGGFQNGTAQAYYPGDSQVDWVCADVYPLTPWKVGDYEPFAALATSFMAWAQQRPKPVMIGEFAVGTSYGDRRARWIQDAGSYIVSHPQIKALAWFEQSLASDPNYFHWALQRDTPALQAFAAIARQSAVGRGG